MPKRTDWSVKLAERISQERGWRVAEDSQGRKVAYAPDGQTIVRLMDTDADPKWRHNTLSGLRRAGLDLYAEFKSESTRPKRERRKAEPVAAKRVPAKRAEAVPLPRELPAAVEDWNITDHAREQAEARGVDMVEVYAAATVPTLTRPTDNASGRHLYQRGDLALVVDEASKTVITVLPPGRVTKAKVAAADDEAAAVTVKSPSAATVAAASGWSDPNEVRTFVAGLTDAFLQCRELGHNWKPWQAYWDDENHWFERALRCARCRTQRWQRLSQTGHVLGGSYVHAEGYLHKGRGRLTGEARDTLRLESVVRVMQGTMSGVDRAAATRRGQ